VPELLPLVHMQVLLLLLHYCVAAVAAAAANATIAAIAATAIATGRQHCDNRCQKCL
jgi:hypothetical protein